MMVEKIIIFDCVCEIVQLPLEITLWMLHVSVVCN